ncbi:MAG: DUF4124 domain-containing protein [Thiohalobacterales bacterium]|nr:DUF4124 domain-containing protein [Thiohalobacterales bacterium]
MPLLNPGCLGVCLLQWFLASAVHPATAYRWTDADGQTHFGDRPPVGQAATGIDLPPADGLKSPGLRPGERATLQAIERRRQARRAEAEAQRGEQRRRRDAELETCRRQRQQLRLGRRHVDGKKISKYLRRHCW